MREGEGNDVFGEFFFFQGGMTFEGDKVDLLEALT